MAITDRVDTGSTARIPVHTSASPEQAASLEADLAALESIYATASPEERAAIARIYQMQAQSVQQAATATGVEPNAPTGRW